MLDTKTNIKCLIDIIMYLRTYVHFLLIFHTYVYVYVCNRDMFSMVGSDIIGYKISYYLDDSRHMKAYETLTANS